MPRPDSTNPRDIICPKCWKREPQFVDCKACGVQGCELCFVACGDGGYACGDCVDDFPTLAIPAEELPEPECSCEEEYIDVDYAIVHTQGCEIHGARR